MMIYHNLPYYNSTCVTSFNPQPQKLFFVKNKFYRIRKIRYYLITQHNVLNTLGF